MNLIPPTQPPAIEVLRQSPILALRKLFLEETATTLMIRGDVSTFYLKQMAQETLRPLLAGRLLLNDVRVVRDAGDCTLLTLEE